MQVALPKRSVSLDALLASGPCGEFRVWKDADDKFRRHWAGHDPRFQCESDPVRKRRVGGR